MNLGARFFKHIYNKFMLEKSEAKMFLTEDEFIILSALRIGLNNTEIKEKFDIELIENDSRLNALYQKYGANSINKLVQIADLKKVEVLPKEKIPYYQYEDSELVHKIKICKNDVINLIKFFENVSDDKQEYELISSFNRIEIKKLNC